MSKVAMVTGGSRGIGREIALALANEGYDISICYIKSIKEADQVVEQIESLGRKAISIQEDISKLENLKKFVDITIQNFERIDILVNNAGIFDKSCFEDSSEEIWDKTLDTNLKSTYFLTQLVAPFMKRQEAGIVINVASTSGNMVVNNSLEYGVSKAGVIYLTKCFAKILAPKIRVNAISPGPTITDMTGYRKNLAKKHNVEKNIPLGKVNTPKQIAELTVFLASSKAKTITGQVIEVDGGLSL